MKDDSERVMDMHTSTKAESGKIVGEKRPTGSETLEGKDVILAILARAADESGFLARLASDPSEALAEYYTLTAEERAALASGDIKRIEGWVGKLDKRLATWLWCRLSQEKW
jgi:hypothetical protein